MKIPTIARMMVPQWYLNAFGHGVSQDRRRQMVREFCLKEKQRMAEERGQPIPDTIDEEVVALTCDMYEFSLRVGHGE